MSIRSEVENLAACFKAVTGVSINSGLFSVASSALDTYQEVFGVLQTPLILTDEEGLFLKRALLEVSGARVERDPVEHYIPQYLKTAHQELIEDLEYRQVKFPTRAPD